MGLFQFLLPNIENESKTTRKILAAVPDDKGDYTPDPVSMTALTLASHIAGSELWFANGVINKSFAPPEEESPKFSKASEVVAFYDKAMPAAITALKGLTAEHLAAPIQFFHMNMPAVVYLNFLLMHSAHHRGQLSAYLRPMGAKVPSIYGGSADEPFEAAAHS